MKVQRKDNAIINYYVNKEFLKRFYLRRKVGIHLIKKRKRIAKKLQKVSMKSSKYPAIWKENFWSPSSREARKSPKDCPKGGE